MSTDETPQSCPVARPVASSPEPPPSLLRLPIGSATAHDIVADQRSATAYRQGAGAELNERDHAVLVHVNRFRIMSGDQLQKLFFPGTDAGHRAARRALLRLTNANVLDRLERRIGGVRGGSAGYLYVAGRHGRRLLGDGRRVHRYREPGWAFLDHTLAIAELYVEAILRADRSTHSALTTFEPEPHSWRQAVIDGERRHLRPDAYAAVEHVNRRSLWFIEIDRGTESFTTIRRKMRTYDQWLQSGIEQAQLGAFPRVLWHAQASQRRLALQRLADDHTHPDGLHTTSGFLESFTEEPP